MKYAYKSATGIIEIEVDERLYETLVAMDKEEINAERKHSRRHPISLEDTDYEGEWFSDGTDILSEMISAETVQRAMSCLSARQQYLVQKICLEGWKYTELATLEGKDESAIRHATERAIARIKKFFTDRPI